MKSGNWNIGHTQGSCLVRTINDRTRRLFEQSAQCLLGYVPTSENPFGTGHIIRYRFTTRTECGIKIKANRGQSLGAHLMDSGGMNSNNTDYDYSGNEPPSLWDVAMTFKGRRDREHQCTDTRVWSRDTALLYF